MSNITFNVEKKYFDMFKSGVKRKEYRAITPRWEKLLTWKSPAHGLQGPKKFETVTICWGYPAKGDTERRITFKFVGISIGYAEAGIGKELMGDQKVFVIEMEDMP